MLIGPRVALGGAFALLACCVAGCDKPRNQSAPASSAATSAAGATPAADDRGTPPPPTPAAHGPLDPVAKNGPIFENWPQPKLALVFSGLQQGYLEPCGCAGLENQKGGLSRRHSLFKQLESEGWPLVAFDVGGQVRRYGRQAVIQLGIMVDALRTMNYEAVTFGTSDLRLPTNELLAVTANLADADGRSCFVSANVGILGFEAQATPRFRVLDTPAGRIGVTAILGDSLRQGVNNEELEIQPAAEALAAVLPELRKAGDILILLAHATHEEAASLAKRFAEFDIVVSAGGADEPPAAATPVAGTKTMLVDVGHKGMYVVVLGLYDDPQARWRYQRVPLDSRFPDSPDMKQLMTAYQGQLEQEGFAGLGLRPLRHPRAAGPDDPLARFAGSASCQACHPTAHGIWSETPHASATETLAKLDPPRHFDPECLSCHATGWSPQDFQPYESGYAGLETTPLLVGNGCENCHGPAAAHVALEQAKDGEGDAPQRDRLRQNLRLVADKQACLECHDDDNSPEFGFKTYWPQVEHVGKE